MNEEWRKIDGYDCEVSSVGNVRRMARPTTWQKARVMKQHLRKGYYFVTLCQNGKTKMFNVHKLVCVAFNGPPVNSDMQVNHIDGNKLNNHYSNLEWVTSSENRKHAFRTGLQVTNLPKPKLDELQVQTIKELAGHGINQRKIAAYFNICQQTVSDINRGKRWGKLTIGTLLPEKI